MYRHLCTHGDLLAKSCAILMTSQTVAHQAPLAGPAGALSVVGPSANVGGCGSTGSRPRMSRPAQARSAA